MGHVLKHQTMSGLAARSVLSKDAGLCSGGVGSPVRPSPLMDVTKPYEFIGFGAMDITKPYEFIGFGAMDVTKPYEFIDGIGLPT